MQTFFLEDEQDVNAFKLTLSDARLTSYLRTTNGDQKGAINLYYWNTILAMSLYQSLQMWEIALRNKLNQFLCWKFNTNWPFDERRAVRQLAGAEKRKLREAVARLQDSNNGQLVTTGAVVADLSAGFWVSLLGSAYDIPFSWRYNLVRKIFPNDETLDRDQASEICGKLLDLRNRVAHHEPIHHLDVQARKTDIDRLLKAMCPVAEKFAKTGCAFDVVWAARPT